LIGNGEGEIVLREGDYINLAFDLSTLKKLTIKAASVEFAGRRVRVFLGEKVTTWINHSGSVWKAVVETDIIPNTLSPNHESWIFEEDTPEGAINPDTQLHALQKGRAYRLEHYRIYQVTSLGAVTAGKYFFDSGTSTVYIQTPDSANPNGRNYWIPSRTTSKCFVYGGAHNTVEISGIEVYYGFIGFDLIGVERSSLRNCTTFGCSFSGAFPNLSSFHEEWSCEYAATGGDGLDFTGYPSIPLLDNRPTVGHVNDVWAHDNGDQGVSWHQETAVRMKGGLVEYNLHGGILGGSGHVVAHGVHTRNNLLTGWCSQVLTAPTGLNGAVLEMLNCISDSDENCVYSYYNPGRIIVRDCEFRNPTTNFFVTEEAADTIEVYGGAAYGTATLKTGPGAVNFRTPGAGRLLPKAIINLPAGSSSNDYTTAALLTHLTVAQDNAFALWNTTDSKTTVLPAGGYQWTMAIFATPLATMTVELFDDGSKIAQAFSGYGEGIYTTGFFIADGSSVYQFKIGGSVVYWNTTADAPRPNLVLVRVW
jgi:hypothetical protein